MRALPYALSFVASTTATALLASPMPVVVSTKEEFIQIQKSVIEDGKTLTIPTRSYNNPLAYGFTGLLALGSFAMLLKESGNEPIVKPTSAPNVINSKPNVVNNIQVAAPNVVNSVRVSSQPQQQYSKDIPSYSDNYDWMNQLHEANCLLIYGAQGTGKTTFVEAEAEARQELGHDIMVLDPHRKYGAWEGLEVVGDGMDYEAIDEALLDLQQLIKNRYLQYSQVPDFNPKPITVICEEFTEWNEKCKNSDSFFSASLSDVRKVRIHVLYVAHGDTLGNLTKKSGMGKNRDLGMMKLELIGKQTETGKTVPSGKANLYLQNQAKPILVSIPDLSKQDQDQEQESVIDDLFDNVIPLKRRA